MSGLIIPENATVTIFIPQGVTLSVRGANGSGANGGGAGILLPVTSTLIIRGGGTLNATGGSGNNAGVGIEGGHISYDGAYDGGPGGTGASGPGAGIGGNGGNRGNPGSGGYPSASPTQTRNGFAGGTGHNGFSMGTLYILDNVTVTGTPGNAGASAAGSVGVGTAPVSRGGNGGGGGASSAASGIGGGAGGGGGGGGGGMTLDNPWAYGGGGGGGAGNGTGGRRGDRVTTAGTLGGNATATTAGSAGVGQGNGAGNGGSGGLQGLRGGNGSVFRASGATVTGAAAGSTLLAAFTVTYDGNGNTGGFIPVDGITYYNNNLLNTVIVLDAMNLTKTGYIFEGWNTEADGSGVDYTQGDTFTITTNTTLYAKWSASRIIVINNNTNSDFLIDNDELDELIDLLNIEPEDSIILTLSIENIDKPEPDNGGEISEPVPGVAEIMEIAQGKTLQFFDISITKTVNGVTTQLTELPVPIRIVLDLSSELTGRTGYSVYRHHDGAVERIGDRNDGGEYFTISRGTGKNGVDQIIINTKRFSTYAVVEHIMVLEINKPEDLDVQARIIEDKNLIYRIDITWGAMKFEFDLDADEWVQEGFDDVNNKITVTNRSNGDVKVSFEITDNMFEGDGDDETVAMNIVDENDVIATDMKLSRVVVSGDTVILDEVSVFLLLDGDPSDDWIENNTSDIFTKVGIITITIEPK